MHQEAAWDEFDDGSGWMGGLAGLRQELLSGDLRLFYLCWLWAVQAGYIREETLEPLPGIGPMTPELQRRLRQHGRADRPPRRSVAELKIQADASHQRHRQAYLAEKARREAEQAAAEQKQRQERKARVARLGERAWQEALGQIGRRQPKGYEMAAELLADLRELAIERGEQAAFEERLDRIVAEHRRKGRFLEQLQRFGLLP